ncbi:acyltransferase [Loktanella sp. F6476L]|uniref:acyltransferase n=1 Tax=Loktanella sp. F6476L TaxID=2926405 RepID=UPI001FF3ACF3|nr:acyltransferase [Loktanella sp. F6476L]
MTANLPEKLTRQSGGPLKKYLLRVVGSEKIGRLILHEAVTMFVSPIPGALGLALRRLFFPLLIGDCGRGVAFSRGIVLRCPSRLSVGDGTMIDDRVFFDIKSSEASLALGARNQIMHAVHFETGYEGNITLGDDCFIGAFAILNGHGGIKIGNNVLIAGHCHIVAGNHRFEDPSVPITAQGIDSQGITIEDDVWLGAGVKVLDGITIGRGSIISAGAVVNRDVPPLSIMAGVPARFLRKRGEGPIPADGQAAPS